MILITGGSGSGKSAYAENRVQELEGSTRIYIATMFPYDKESFKRIDRHRAMRAGKGFETVECYTGLKNAPVPADSVVLLECMSNLVANEMFQEGGAGADAVEAVMTGIQKLQETVKHLVIVTNEIFSEDVPYEGETKQYQALLGKVNQKMAQMADEVIEVVYGIPVFHKGREA